MVKFADEPDEDEVDMALQELIAEGCVHFDGERYFLTPKGRHAAEHLALMRLVRETAQSSTLKMPGKGE